MALDFSAFGTPVEQTSTLDFSKFGTAVEPPEKQSAFRQVADVPLGVAKGAVQGVRMLADVFGAGSETSNTIRSAETYLAGLMSAQAKNDQQEIARIMKEAEDKGVLDQVKAGIKAFTIAPVDTLSSALGTAAPVVAASLGAAVLGAPAVVGTGVGALLGAGMGAGVVKGSIYEETKKALIEAGAAEPEAEQKAQLAQSYGGKNLDQILLGTALGGVAAVGPLEKGAAGILARNILGKAGVEEAAETAGEQAVKGALRRRAEAGLLEAVPEAVQAGQEQVAQNIALQREGFDVPTFRGAVSAATLEAIAGGGLGATVGGGAPEVAKPEVETIPPVAPEAAAPEVVTIPPVTEAPVAEATPEQKIVEETTGISREPAPSAEESADVLAGMYRMDDAEGRAYAERMTQERLLRQQKEIDADAERIAELNRRQGIVSPEVTPAAITERPSMAEAPPEVTPREELLAKQAEVDRRRLEAGLPTGESSVTPGLKPAEVVAEEPKPVPKLVDNRPLAERAAKNRLLVMKNMLANQGGDPQSLTIVPHPTATGKFAIQSLDVPVKLTKNLPATAINRPETQPIIDPVNAYVEVQRRTNTPAAHKFISDFESGNITREDVALAVEQERKASQPQPLTYTATGAPGIVSAGVSKPRGARDVPKFGEQPPVIEAPPEEPPVEEPPPPTSTQPQTLQEFERRMPIVFDKAEVRAANAAGNFTQLTKALQLSTNPAIRRIGQLGGGIASKITLRKPGRLDPGVAGVYMYADDSIKMIPSHAGNEHTNAHETLHALLSKAQRYPTDRQKPVVEKIEKLYEHVKKEFKRKGITAYGLKNPREFTAEAMTNPEFQYELMQIPYSGRKSAWTEFVKLVADLLGIQNTNALTEVMNLVDKLAMQKQPRQVVKDKGLVDQAMADEEPSTPVAPPPSQKQVPQSDLSGTAAGGAPVDNYLYSVEPTIKSDRLPSYKRGVETLRRKFDKGEIDADGFANRVDIIAKQIQSAELAKELKPRERGPDYIRQRLLEAKRRGDLSEEAVDFAEWFIQRNPKLVDDLAVSIKTPKEDGVGGTYASNTRLMTLMKDGSSNLTVVHEILHHIERMMPNDIQSAIRKSWAKALVEAQKKATTTADIAFFKDLMDYHFGSGDRKFLKLAIDAIKKDNVDLSLYQLTSPSEFWAVNAAEIMNGKFMVKGSLLKRLKNWLSELKEKAKDLFGLQNNAAIIRALDSLSKGDGKFVTDKMIDQNVDPKLSITGKATAKAQQLLQKQKVPTTGLDHIPEELRAMTQPIFFPQNKTVLDRIDGMKDKFWQRVAQGVADQYRTIKEYSPVAYMQARISKSIDGALEGLMLHGHVFNDGGALNIRDKTKGMLKVLEPVGKELDSYLMWVALNREFKLPEPKRSKIQNMDKLVANRAQFAAGELNGKPRIDVYEAVAKEMNALNKSVLDVALQNGLINEEGYKNFSSNVYYIPFYRKMENGDLEDVQTSSGLTSQEFSKELKGGEAPFGDLMENVLRNWSHILSASMKNQAATTTLEAAMEQNAAVPNLKPGLEWKDGKVYSTESGKLVAEKKDENGNVLYKEGELRPDLTKNEAGMAKIVKDGQVMYFQVTDPLLMEAISSIGYLGPKSKFLDVARDFKNILQFGVTLSPTFKVNNLIRDSVAAMGVSELAKDPISNIRQGISLSDPESPTYISALAGGAIFNFGSAYEGDQAKMIKRLLDKGVSRNTILDSDNLISKGLRVTWDKYQEWGNKSEAANRLALYQQMRDKGMSHLEASFKARDLLDFSMQGSWPAFRMVTQVVPFMNARIQGLYKLGRDGIIPTYRVLYNTATGKEIEGTDKQKAQAFLTITAAVGLASAVLYLAFKDDEDFKKRDQWDRDNFWWFKLPGMDVAYRVPKPFEIGAFGTLVERTLEQIYDSGAEGKQFTDSLSRTLWDTFAMNPTPQMIKPLLDIYANKDSFTGAPIESAGLERLSKQERKIDTTSPIAVALGGVSSLFPEKYQLSPVQMDYMIKGYLGWLGGTAAVTSTYAVAPFREGEYPDARWLDRLSLGLAKELPTAQSKYVTAFYDSNKEISQAFADMRHYAEAGDSEKVQRILEERGDKIALAKFYDKTAKSMASVRQQINIITKDATMGGAEKKMEIDRLKQIISTLAQQAEEVRKSMKK